MVTEKPTTSGTSRRFVLLGLAGLLILALAAGTAWFIVHQPGHITEFSLPTDGSAPEDITTGPNPLVYRGR